MNKSSRIYECECAYQKMKKMRFKIEYLSNWFLNQQAWAECFLKDQSNETLQ